MRHRATAVAGPESCKSQIGAHFLGVSELQIAGLAGASAGRYGFSENASHGRDTALSGKLDIECPFGNEWRAGYCRNTRSRINDIARKAATLGKFHAAINASDTIQMLINPVLKLVVTTKATQIHPRQQAFHQTVEIQLLFPQILGGNAKMRKAHSCAIMHCHMSPKRVGASELDLLMTIDFQKEGGFEERSMLQTSKARSVMTGSQFWC